jgi:hypothetical protein
MALSDAGSPAGPARTISASCTSDDAAATLLAPSRATVVSTQSRRQLSQAFLNAPRCGSRWQAKQVSNSMCRRCACTKLVARVALRSSDQRRMHFGTGPGEICALAGAQTDNNMPQIRNAKSAVRLKGLRRESLNHAASADSRTHSSVILFERTPHRGRVA